MSRLPVLGLVALVLALAVSAGAKGPMPVRICGASGCAVLPESARWALSNGLGSPFTLLAGPKPTPFYVVRLRRFDSRGPVPRPWVLARGAIRIAEPGTRPYWRSLPAPTTAVLRRVAAGIAPYPASPGWSTTPAPAAHALSGSPPSAAVLGISFRRAGGALAWFDPLSLIALPGRKAPLAGHFGSWAFSADRATVALGNWKVPELRLVDARTMRVVGDIRLARGPGGVDALFWLRRDRLLVLARDDPSALLVVVDPQTRRVLRRIELRQPVWRTARVGDELVLLLGGSGSFAPAQIVVANGDGDLRTTTVARIRVGSVVDEQSGDYRARTLSPAFAVDPVGRRALLIAADSTAAEIDLDTQDVRYHELDRPSLFGRLARWLVPAAQAKVVEGPTREARWLGSGLIAVTGSDYSLTKGPDGKERQIAKAVGLTLVDTSSWRSRVVDAEASGFSVVGDLVVAAGGTYDSAEPLAGERGIGLVAYGLDGRERWRLHPGERRWLTTVGAIGYVYLDERHVEVVDVTAGAVTRTLTRDGEPWPVLLAAQASAP